MAAAAAAAHLGRFCGDQTTAAKRHLAEKVGDVVVARLRAEAVRRPFGRRPDPFRSAEEIHSCLHAIDSMPAGHGMAVRDPL